MLVYGDRVRTVRTADAIAAIRARSDLTAAFLEAAELAQGVADTGFAEDGLDRERPENAAAMRLVAALARALLAAWDGAPSPAPDGGEIGRALDALGGLDLPDVVQTKPGEGHAFYALYPETYAEAARRARLPPTTVVVGLRSIGAGLAGMVAAAVGAENPVTVRPSGHPFDRRLVLDDRLEARLREAEVVAVVDEGPGLSGSSFAAAAALPTGRTVLFPSHPGPPGAQASDETRRRWDAAEKAFVGFEEAVAPRLPGWVEDVAGPPLGRLQDLSGGAWRALRGVEAPSHTWQERRKYLLRSDRGTFLLKFVGLGRRGEEAFAAARHLQGFVPEALGFRRGFLVERWIEAAPAPGSAGTLSPVTERALARYLRRRAGLACPEAGASPAELMEMAEVNTREALGSAAAASVPSLKAYEPRRVWTDNRLHAWEWVGGLKTDAVDHARAHDLVGAQDIAWDVAGGAFELGLDEASLARAVGCPPEAAALLAPAYLAFQLGYWSMAADAHGHWPQEQARLAAQRERYAAALARRLG